MSRKDNLPPVFAPRGSSSAPRMAQYLARKLEECQLATRIDPKSAAKRGDGASKPAIVIDATQSRPLAKRLKKFALPIAHSFCLAEMGIADQAQADFDPWEAAQILDEILDEIAPDIDRSPPAVEIGEPASPACYLNHFPNW